LCGLNDRSVMGLAGRCSLYTRPDTLFVYHEGTCFLSVSPALKWVLCEPGAMFAMNWKLESQGAVTVTSIMR